MTHIGNDNAILTGSSPGGETGNAGQRQWMGINQCLDTALAFLDDRLTRSVNIRREYGQPPPVACNPAELNQAFITLLDNALDAVRGNGSIILRSGTGTGSQHVWVEIEDTGEGIPAEALPRFLDPVCTTRTVGQGTDSGLFRVYRIVQQHGGQIIVSSQAGSGSVFRIMLPLRQREGAPPGEEGASGIAC